MLKKLPKWQNNIVMGNHHILVVLFQKVLIFYKKKLKLQ